jgi:hypothetical protein
MTLDDLVWCQARPACVRRALGFLFRVISTIITSVINQTSCDLFEMFVTLSEIFPRNKTWDRDVRNEVVVFSYFFLLSDN